MKVTIITLILLCTLITVKAQSPIGKWKMVSHISEYAGEKMDSHAALLTQRPCAAKIIYEVNEDGTYRLNAATSGCDEKYVNIQQKLYSKTKWKLEGNKIMISATNFAVGQSYVVAFSSNQMIWTGTEGQGVITYQKL